MRPFLYKFESVLTLIGFPDRVANCGDWAVFYFWIIAIDVRITRVARQAESRADQGSQDNKAPHCSRRKMHWGNFYQPSKLRQSVLLSVVNKPTLPT